MEKVEAPVADHREIDFQFPKPQRSGQRAKKLAGIHQAYGQNVVYRGMNFVAERGQRIVLVGPNGAGKSTLLKILAGVLVPQSGERTLGHNVKTGYYSQYRVDMLRTERTVLDEALDTPQRVSEQFVRTLLGCFLFRGDDVFKPVGVLSGGEKSRLALVKILLDPPNLLLMDEPTTHLDLSSIDALAYALDQFPGTLIFISHDVYFIRALANHVVHVNAGRLTLYPGGYQYYLDKTKAESERAGLTAGSSGTVAPENRNRLVGKSGLVPDPNGGLSRKEQKRLEAEERQVRSRERKAQQEIVKTLEKEIQVLEARHKEIVAELERPQTYEKPGTAVAINRELLAIQEQLGELTPRWEAEATRLAEMESA
jgi:ATP-binding cassette subfamily F protein 3